MVQYKRLIKKGEKLRLSVKEEGGSGANVVAVSGGGYSKTTKQKILFIIFLSLLSCCYIFSFSSFSLLGKITLFIISFINSFLDFLITSSIVNFLVQMLLAERLKDLVLMNCSLHLFVQEPQMVYYIF